MICDARVPVTIDVRHKAWDLAFERTLNVGAGALLRVTAASAVMWGRASHKDDDRGVQDWLDRDADVLECSEEDAGASDVAEKVLSDNRLRQRDTTSEAPPRASLDSSPEIRTARAMEKTWATFCRCMNLPC